ncbi:MAG: cell division cycle 123 family protein [Planctomycetes bacterium]|nr:cell division cycle 123 family protein [Planctomycetota bacterium]
MMIASTPSAMLWRELVDSRTNDYVRRWMRHFPELRATCVEQWIQALVGASVPTWVHPLSAAERDLLVDEHWRRVTERPGHAPEEFESIVEALEKDVVEAQEASTEAGAVGAAFVRLGSRAPLDSPLLIEGSLQVDSGSEALEVLLQSERVFDDLCLMQECGYVPALVVRPWLDLAPGTELRAFIRGRELVGLSQRQVDGVQPELVARAAELEEAVRRRCAELAPRWPLDDLVADFVIDDEAALLSDLHPFLDWTDPALFSWEQPFDRYKFRYLH